MFSAIKLFLYKVYWRKRNKHNRTSVANIFNPQKVQVGNGTYGYIKLSDFNSNDTGIVSVGNYCSIADDVTFILSAEHKINTVSTYPFRFFMNAVDESFSKGNIIVEDDVWIGYGATILSGVTIGQGAVVAAGAVVVKDIPPYAIVGGVPAKVIKYRFSPEIIDQMIKIDYSKLTKEMIRDHISDLYQEVDEQMDFSWLSGKINAGCVDGNEK